MATAFQTLDGAPPKSKKHGHALNHVGVLPAASVVGSLSLPKIGPPTGVAGTSPNSSHTVSASASGGGGGETHKGAPPHTHTGSNGHHTDVGMFPKLKSKPDGSDALTTRRKQSDESQLPTLPSVSPRIEQQTHTIVTKRKSTKKKRKHTREGHGKSQVEPTAPSNAAPTNANAPTATNTTGASDTEYEYDDDEYTSSPSGTGSASHSRHSSVDPHSAPPPPPPPAPSSDSPSLSVHSSPSQQEFRRKVGPSVQLHPALPSPSAATEIGEELDSSFYVPAATPGKALSGPDPTLNTTSHGEVEEDLMQATLSPKALSEAFDTSITDDVGEIGSPSHVDGDESIRSLLAASPASTHRMHPTSIHPPQHPINNLKSPTKGIAPTHAANKTNTNKKKSNASNNTNQPQVTPKGKSAGGTGAAGQKKKPSHGVLSPTAASTKSSKPLVVAPTVSAAPTSIQPPDDEYGDNDWRAQTIAFSPNELASTSMSDMPSEMIRFTVRPESWRRYYDYANENIESVESPRITLPQRSEGMRHTTSLEFSRSQKILQTNSNTNLNPGDPSSSPVDELQGVTQWVPIYSTTLHTHRVDGAAPGADLHAIPSFATDGALSPSTFTLDRLATFGADPTESLLVQLWNTAYADVSSDEDESSDSPPNGTTRATSLNRTLLAEFQTSVQELAAHQKQFDKTQPTLPHHAPMPPRSALKASNQSGASGSGDGSPPPKLHVRFFDVVEVFRLSAPLARTRELSSRDGVESVVGGGGVVDPSSPLPSTPTRVDPQELAALFTTEIAFQRRVRSAGTTKPMTIMKKATNVGTSKSSVRQSTPPLPSAPIRIVARGSDLAKMTFHGRANPILELYLFLNKEWYPKPIYKSECQFQTLDPVFKPFILAAPSTAALLDAPLLMKVVHFDEAIAATCHTTNGPPSVNAPNGQASGTPSSGVKPTNAAPNNANTEQDTIGQCITSMRAMIDAATSVGDAAPPLVASTLTFSLTHPVRTKLSKRPAGVSTGRLTLQVNAADPTILAASRRGSMHAHTPNNATSTSALPHDTNRTTPPSGSAAARRKSNGGTKESRPASKLG